MLPSGAFVRGPWSRCCSEFKASKDGRSDTGTEVVLPRPSDNSGRLVLLCRFEASWSFSVLWTQTRMCLTCSCLSKGSILFIFVPLFEPRTILMSWRRLVSRLKWKVKTCDGYGFWSRANWTDFFSSFSFSLVLFNEWATLGKFLKISEV